MGIARAVEAGLQLTAAFTGAAPPAVAWLRVSISKPCARWRTWICTRSQLMKSEPEWDPGPEARETPPPTSSQYPWKCMA